MKPSSLQKSFARRTFFQTLFFSTLLFLIVAYFYWLAQPMGAPLDLIEFASIFLFMVLYSILSWLFQKNTLTKLIANRPATPPTKKASPVIAQESETDRNQRVNHERKLFVHLFSVLQREGRLLDFFQEDLSRYEDGQIGAAVRSIHENCKKTMDRYLSPGPVMQQAEGETVEIAAGFDPHAVRLVGNVVGQPPFSGIVRHRGWKLNAVSLPTLSEAGNPDILAPAEIEIQ